MKAISDTEVQPAKAALVQEIKDYDAVQAAVNNKAMYTPDVERGAENEQELIAS